MSSKIIIGSRGSDLALWQANYTKDALEKLGHTIEIKIIKTQGDKIQHLSFDKMEGKGFFTKELEDCLLSGEIDLAVHSHKDLPTTNPPGLTIAAVSYRENSAETLLIRPEAYDSSSKFRLKANAIVGTSSLRRKSQLLHHRPDLTINDLRGNVPTRIGKLVDKQYDAIVLASAGLKRLGLNPEGLIQVELSQIEFIPAPAQGVLAYQIRENDQTLHKVLSNLHHEDVYRSISIERGVLNRLDGGCQLPLGVFCQEDELGFHSWVSLQPLNGSPYRRFYHHSESNIGLIEKLIHRLEQAENRRVYISREAEDASLFIAQTSSYGFETLSGSPLITETVEVNHMPFTEWVFFSSRNCVKHFFEQELKIPEVCSVAALGSGTADELLKHGIKASFIGNDGKVEETAAKFLAQVIGKSVLFPIGDASIRSVQKVIENQVQCHEIVVYRQSENPDFICEKADIYVFTSPRLFEEFKDKAKLSNSQIVVIGEKTAATIEATGIKNVLISRETNEQALADLVCGLA
ncbi:MAG: hydroxymethylbilane synthase [Bacteroidia bacterium]